jgi:hypothetical protein
MAEPTKKRRTYWIAETVTPLMRDRALQLAQRGFSVQFFTSVNSLVKELELRRAAILVVSDDGDEKVCLNTMRTLLTMPEIQGARLVLVASKPSDPLKRLAAAGNFRDLLPWNLDERQWLARFAYATAGKPMAYVQPAGQITLNNISALAVPARVTWVGKERLRIECRVRPPVGANLGLSGAFAEACGVSAVSLKVVSTDKSHLLHRFSDAVVAEWSVPASLKEQAQLALAAARQHDQGPRCRVFVAVQATALRQQVLTSFDDDRFELNTALQKQSIVDEPRFFTPDLVVIEDALARDEDGQRFHKMMEQITAEATVVILGSVPELAQWQRRHVGKRIVALQSLPANLSHSVLAKYLPLKRSTETAAAGEGAMHVPAEHAWSFAEATFPARLTRVHPLAAQVAMPMPLANFALCRLESPLARKILGRNPWLKITASYPSTHPDAGSFGFYAEGYLADLDLGERRAMAQSLAKLVEGSLTRLDSAPTFPDPPVPGGWNAGSGETRTPELGSVIPLATAAASLGQSAAAAQPAVAAAAPHAQSVPAHQSQTHAPAASAAMHVAQAAQIPGGIGTAPGRRSIAAVAAIVPGPSVTGSAAPDLSLEDAPGTQEETLIPKTEIAELAAMMRPAIGQINAVAGLAGEIRQDVVRSVKKRVKENHLKTAFAWVAIALGTAIVLWFISAVVAPNWDRSGSVYSEQLKLFAPKTGDGQ